MPPSRSRSPSGKKQRKSGVNRSRGGSRSSTGSTGSDGETDHLKVNLKYGKNVGYVLATVFADYLGTCPVKEKSGTEVAAAAVKRINALKQPKIDVILVVSIKGIYIINNATGEAVKAIPIAEVSYVGLDPNNSKNFSFITNNDALHLITLHSFKCTSGSVQDVPVAINEAFMIKSGSLPTPDPNLPRKKMSVQDAKQRSSIARNKRHSSVGSNGSGGSPKKSAPDPGFIGAFEAKYLCSLAVPEKTGQATVEEAWSNASSIGIPKGSGVIILVSSSGVKTIDAISQEPMFNTVIKDVTMVTCTGSKANIFAYISYNDISGRIVCHFYNRVDTEACNDVILALGVAFKKARDEHANPFLVKGEDAKVREKPPAVLLKRQIRRGNLVPVKMLGAGQFGEVWLGNLAVPSAGGQSSKQKKVAVKLLKGNARDEDKEDFTRECEMMLRLNHPNLVTFLGAAVQQKPWLCVLEFLAYGDIKAVLEACSEKGVEVSSSTLLHFSKQVAHGMAHMSDLGLVHMDLAARNILLHTKNSVKVADFGLTHEVDDAGNYRLPVGPKLPMKWMSPESMDHRIFSEATDVWGYGITVWEMFAMGAMPYPDHTTKEIQTAVREGLRNEETELMPKGLHDLLLLCWAARAGSRPRFHEIVTELDKFDAKDVTGEDLGKKLKDAKDQKLVKKSSVKAPAWYFGNMPKALCDKVCLEHPAGSFLVRLLPNQPQKPEGNDGSRSWCVTVNDHGSLKNFQIKTGEAKGTFVLGGISFDSLDAAVGQLQTKQFTGKNGPMVLGSPCRKPRVQKRGSVVRRPSDVNDPSSLKPRMAKNKMSRDSGGRNSRRNSAGSDGMPAGPIGGSTTWNPGGRTPAAGALKESEVDSNKSFDPAANTKWLHLKMKKAHAESVLKSGRRGDFLVRSNKDASKYFIMISDGADSLANYTVPIVDEKLMFAKKPYANITDLIASLVGVQLPYNSATISIIRPIEIDSPGSPKAAAAGTEQFGFEDAETNPAAESFGGFEDAVAHGGDSANGDNVTS